MPFNKVIIAILVFMLVLSACTPQSTGIDTTPTTDTAIVLPSPTPEIQGEYNDSELARAVTLGFGVYRTDNPQITYAEFFTMLDHTVALANEAKLDDWKQQFPDARTSALPMDRFNGMLALYYAAETLGEPYIEVNADWGNLHSIIGEQWDKIYPNQELFPNAYQETKFDGNRFSYEASAYFYSFGRQSLVSGNLLFDYDPDSKTMRTEAPFLYSEALLAALRLHDSAQPVYKERVLSEADQIILDAADQRRESIHNAATTVKVEGTMYYVSNQGDDTNDGLTPETAWATLDKVNSAYTQGWDNSDSRWNNDHFPELLWASAHRDQIITLQPGDGVFFERGGEWRGMLRTVAGVTYSAYGNGDKPKIIGSPENGSGAEKWSLVEGTDNIWVFYKPLQDCGGILLGEDTVAVKQPALWYQNEYYYVGDDQYPQVDDIGAFQIFDVKMLDNLRFFNDIRYGPQGFEFGTWGDLYLRSDEGNPGVVYSSIEFFTGNNDWNHGAVNVEDGSTVDNLNIMFGASGISAQGHNNVTIQNNEVGWIGGIICDYDATGLGADSPVAVVRCGDGILIGGKNNRAINNYVYQNFDWAFTIEGYLMGNESPEEYEASLRENDIVQGNLVEKSSGGVLIASWYAYSKRFDAPVFRNMDISNNIILYSGQGGWAHLEDVGLSYLADIGVFLNPGCENVNVSGNILYSTRSENSLVHIGFDTGMQDTIRMNDNIYAQNDYGYLLQREENGEQTLSNDYIYNLFAKQTIADVLGDSTGFALPLDGMQAGYDLQDFTQAVDIITAK